MNGEWLNVQTVNLISTNRILSVKHNAVRFQNTSKQSEYPGLGYLDCLLVWTKIASFPTLPHENISNDERRVRR